MIPFDENRRYYFNILALDRSRSTISDIFISRKTEAISLGEVARVISPVGNEKLYFEHDIKCTCGELISGCEFWREIFVNENRVGAYFNNYLSANYSCCDSSKTIRHSRLVRGYIPNNELVGVLVLRDFKEWSMSVKRALGTKNEGQFSQIFRDRKFWKSSIRLSMRRFYICRALEYTITNLRLARELSNYKTKIIVDKSEVYHCFDSFSRQSTNELLSKKHIIRGNRIMDDGYDMNFWELKHPLSKILARVIKTALSPKQLEND